jgi:hypothetical protein
VGGIGDTLILNDVTAFAWKKIEENPERFLRVPQSGFEHSAS